MPKKTVAETAPTALHQIAALPWRIREGRLEVLIITTRETRRWTIPKGWPMKGRTDPEAARIEAEQEAGVVGKTAKKPIGRYTYWKRREARFDLVRVVVHALEVTGSLETWKEMTQRELRWVVPKDAAIVVDEPELATLLRAFPKKVAKL